MKLYLNLIISRSGRQKFKVTTDGSKREYVKRLKNSAMKPTHLKSTKKFPRR